MLAANLDFGFGKCVPSRVSHFFAQGQHGKVCGFQLSGFRWAKRLNQHGSNRPPPSGKQIPGWIHKFAASKPLETNCRAVWTGCELAWFEFTAVQCATKPCKPCISFSITMSLPECLNTETPSGAPFLRRFQVAL